MARKTGVVRDDRYLRHGAGFYHPESPERLKAIYAMLDSADMKGRFVSIPARHASHDEIALIHGRSYIDLIAGTANMSYYSLDPDTSTTPYTYDTAKLAVGGLLNAVDAVMAGEADNAMAFIRPPGHHAGQSHAAGFCIFNNVAIAARYVMTKHKLERVLIVDWDLHHGDGTQALFYRDRRVLFFSTHQFPHYPGTGRITEIGMGEGLGYTINVPFSARTGNDMYIKAFRGLLQPVALKFKPEIILLSAGFDAYHQDPLGDMKVTAAGFAAMMRVLMDIADASCGGRIVATLEGGYHIGGVTESVRAVLMEMSDATRCPERDLQRWEAEADQGKDSTVRRVQEQINPIWQLF